MEIVASFFNLIYSLHLFMVLSIIITFFNLLAEKNKEYKYLQ